MNGEEGENGVVGEFRSSFCTVAIPQKAMPGKSHQSFAGDALLSADISGMLTVRHLLPANMDARAAALMENSEIPRTALRE